MHKRIMKRQVWLLGMVALFPVVEVMGGETRSFKDVRVSGTGGRKVALAAPAKGATAVVFYSTECPISNAYSPTLDEIGKEFKGRPVRLVGVCVDPDLSDHDVEQHARDFGLHLELARDPSGLLARKLGVKMTPEAVVLDDRGMIRYRGRIDDQFAARGVRRANPSGNELRDSLAAVLAGKEVAVPHAEAVGCPLPETASAPADPTYSKDVAPILNANCVECHRRGQVGPFALESYDQARKRASDIATVVEGRSMPPWKPAPHFGTAFRDSRALSESMIATLVAWADSGAPEGDRSQLPAPPTFSSDWALGTPDLVIDLGVDFPVAAGGDDVYRCFVAPTNLPDDVFISAIDYRPGNRKVVHHVLAYVDVSGKARERDLAEPGPGYACFAGPGEPIHGDLGGWAPGMRPSFLPDGVGRSLPKKSDVIIQVHYHPSGKAETDRTQVGLYFAKKPIKQTLHWNAALNTQMRLPPGKANIEIKAEWEIPVDLVAYAVTPHMHLLGRDMTMSLQFPDGEVKDLIKIDDWDFNWQQAYYFERPFDVPKGSRLLVESHYDNSASNPRNPNHPPKLVGWGEATNDEMCIGFLAVTRKGQDLTRPGEKDDLAAIFRKQMEERRAELEKRIRAAREKSAAAPDAGKR